MRIPEHKLKRYRTEERLFLRAAPKLYDKYTSYILNSTITSKRYDHFVDYVLFHIRVDCCCRFSLKRYARCNVASKGCYSLLYRYSRSGADQRGIGFDQWVHDILFIKKERKKKRNVDEEM